MFVYKINAGPLFARRAEFLRSGMFHVDLSCPGKPGIGFDFEYSVRTWSLGWQVGLFSANWTGHVGNSTESGTRKDLSAWQERRRMELRNNGLLYEIYPDYHHMEGNRLASESIGLLREGKNAYRIHNNEHVQFTMKFLRSFQFSVYCDMLGYRDLMEKVLGTCCKELIPPEKLQAHPRYHNHEEYQCISKTQNWESRMDAVRSFLKENNYWLEEENEWKILPLHINGDMMKSYLISVMRNHSRGLGYEISEETEHLARLFLSEEELAQSFRA